MGNPFVHIELSTDDVSKAKKFYKGLFQWKVSDMKLGPGMTYAMIDFGKKDMGGGMQKNMSPMPSNWLPYVQVDDVKKTIAKAKKMGAQILIDYQPIPDMGALGIFTDPSGATLGVWEAAKAAPRKASARKPAKKTAKKSRR
ncbi:MAG: VOC family protein [Myxococcota bacterium]